MKNRLFKTACRVVNAGRKLGGRCMVYAGAGLGATATVVAASAQTDITSTITSLNGYWTSVETLGIGILLFVLGKRVLRKGV